MVRPSGIVKDALYPSHGIDFTELVILRPFSVNLEPRNPKCDATRVEGCWGFEPHEKGMAYTHCNLNMKFGLLPSERCEFVSLDLTDPLSNRARR